MLVIILQNEGELCIVSRCKMLFMDMAPMTPAFFGVCVILFQISVCLLHFEKLKVIGSSVVRACIGHFSVISRVNMLNLI